MAKRSKKNAAGLQKSPATEIEPMGDRWGKWLPALVLFVAVALAYQPVWHAGFIWDDDLHVTANPVIIGPLGLKEIWTTNAAQYYPLVLTTFWFEHALWGLAPLPYHLVSVLMQGACAVLLWQVLRRLQIPGAWLGAALWALHPVQVETVAWITELKNTQSCLFYLLAIFFFVRGTRAAGPVRLRLDALAWVFAALAMASKSSAVVLPAVLCLCAWWVEGRWHWRTLLRVAPTIFMAVAASLLAVWTVKMQGVDFAARSLPERAVLAGDVFWFYLGKLAWPHPLIFIYPRWNLEPLSAWSWLPALGVPVLLGVLWFRREAWARAGFFAFAYFLIALLPVLGLVNHYFLRYSFVADHLQYLAGIGPLALAGAFLTTISRPLSMANRWLRPALAVGLLGLLGFLSWQRAWVYENQSTLWTDTLARNPGCWMAENNLGDCDFRNGRVNDAIGHYRRALAIDPRFAEIYNNLGVALSRIGQLVEAQADFEHALQLNPGLASAHDHLGNVLVQEGRADDAIDQFRQAAKLDPSLRTAPFNLANALLQQGRVDEAITQYRAILAGNPAFAEAHSNLGLALLQQGNFDEAIDEFQRALALSPDFAQAHNNLGMALAQSGRLEAALAQFQEAVRLQPDYPAAQSNLARAMSLLHQAP